MGNQHARLFDLSNLDSQKQWLYPQPVLKKDIPMKSKTFIKIKDNYVYKVVNYVIHAHNDEFNWGLCALD